MVNLFRLPIIKAANRSTQFLANLKDYNPDAVLMNDVGLHWKNIPMADSWAERTITGFPTHKFQFSYNTHEDKQELVQWGGTGLLAMDQFRTRTYKQMGSDPPQSGALDLGPYSRPAQLFHPSCIGIQTLQEHL